MLDLASESKSISFKQGIESLQTLLTELKKSHPELSLKVQTVQLECKKLLTDQQEIDDEHSIYQEHLNATRQQLLEAKAVADVETIQNELTTLPEQLQTPKTLAFSSLQTKLEALQKSCQEQQTKLTGELRQGLETRQKQLEKAKSEWQQSVLRQQKLNQETHAKLKTELRQLEERLSKRLAELTQRINHLETWAEGVKTFLSEFKETDLKTRTQVQSLQTQLTQLLTAQQIHQSQCAEYQAEIQALQTQLAKAPTKEEIAHLEAKLKAVEEQLAELSNEKLSAQSLHSKLEALQKLQEDKLKAISSTQRQEIETQQKRLAQLKMLQTELSQQVEKQNKQNQEQLQALKGEVRNLEERFKKELAGVKKEVKELKTEVTRVGSKVDSVEAKVGGLETKVDAQDPRYTVAVKILKLRAAILEDQFITDELKYYVAPNGEGQQGLGDHQPLYEWTYQQFLAAKAEPKVLLLQGVAGAGKSTFNRYLMRQLWHDEAWKTFKPGMPAPKTYVPVFIPLGSPQTQPAQLLKYLNDLPELIDDLTDQEINVLKTDYQLLLIADGYDEIPGNHTLNLYDSNQLQQYPGIKLIIGCRTQRAQELNETDVFTPHHTSGQAQYAYFKRRHVSPLNDEQIHDYIHKYLAQNQHRTDIVLWKKSQMYLDQLNKLPDLKALLTTPFALLMGIEVLPSIVEEAERIAAESKRDDKKQENQESKTSRSLQFTRAKLYDVFMDHWFKRQAEKARQAGDTTNPKELIRQYQKFCFKLAECLRAAGITAVQYPYGEEVLDEDVYADKPKEAVDPKGSRGPWVKKLLGTENETMVRARKGAPLTIAAGNYYQFIHASFIDYFSTTAMVAQVQPSVAVKPKENKMEMRTLQDTVSSSLEDLLGDRLMSRDQWYLLADRIQQEPELQSQLLKIIVKSKQEVKLAIAASNAISALNAAGVNLSGYDFQGVRIPGADLSGALLHGTQFQGADLSGVNFQGAWLAEAKFKAANLEKLRFGERAYIEVQEEVHACEYSPDGHWLSVATGSYSEGAIKIYEPISRRLVHTLKGHEGKVTSVCWDQSGERLASASYDKTVRVWEVSTGKELLCFKKNSEGYDSDWVNSVSWDLSGERLAAGYREKAVRVWEISTGKELQCLWHKSDINSVSWDPRGEHLAVGCKDDKTVWVWEVSTGKQLHRLRGHTNDVWSVSWDPNGKYLASGSRDETVRVWEVSTGIELRCLNGHTNYVCSVSWDPRGERLASGSQDGTIRVWEVSSGKVLRCLTGGDSGINSVSWNREGEYLASGSWDKVGIWEVSTGRELRRTNDQTFFLHSTNLDQKGERLVSGSRDGTVCVREVSTGKILSARKVDRGGADIVRWDQEGERLALGCGDRTVRIWEASTGKELGCFWGHKESIRSVCWDWQGKCLASCDEREVRVWEVSTGKELLYLPKDLGRVTGISLDPQGKRLARCGEGNTIRVWEISTGDELCCLEGHKSFVSKVIWDQRGERLVSASYDNTVRVWEVSTGKELQCFKGHTYLLRVIWDWQEKRLISASRDGTVRIWDVSNGKELYKFVLPQKLSGVELVASPSDELIVVTIYRATLGCFELVPQESSCIVRLKWLIVDGSVGLNVIGVDLTDAYGLSSQNYELLKQRGAIGQPADTPSLETKEGKNNTLGDSKDESKLTGIQGLAASAAQVGTFATPASAKASAKAPAQESKSTLGLG